MKALVVILLSFVSLKVMAADPTYEYLDDNDVTAAPCEGSPATNLECYSSAAKFRKDCETDKGGTIVGFACAQANGNYDTTACTAICRIPAPAAQ